MNYPDFFGYDPMDPRPIQAEALYGTYYYAVGRPFRVPFGPQGIKDLPYDKWDLKSSHKTREEALKQAATYIAFHRGVRVVKRQDTYFILTNGEK